MTVDLPEGLARIAQRVGEACGEGLRISLLSASPGEIGGKDHRGCPTLFWDLDPSRVCIGPLRGDEFDGCLYCLTWWIEHNRPDAHVWRTLPRGENAAAVTRPWPPVLFAMLERESIRFASEPSPRTVVEIHAKTLRVERHRYLPAPGCERCSPVATDEARFGSLEFSATGKPEPQAFRTRSVAASVEELRGHYVDYRTGLVRHMYRDATSAMLPMWGAETTVPGTELTEVGYGRHITARKAEGVAILEALERFCSQAPRNRRAAVRGSYHGLRAQGFPVVDPESLILSAPSQRHEPAYRLSAYTPDLEHDWIWAYSFALRGPALVSQQFAFYDYRTTPMAERFVLETSNGCALGGSLVEATFHGLLEVIERDAYMTRWHTHGNPRRLDLRDPSMPHVKHLHARALAEGLELEAFAINLEVDVPTVLAMIVDPRRDAPVASYCASGAAPTAEGAIFSALVEVCSSIGVYQRQFGNERDRARALFADASLVQEMRDHVLLYSLPETLERLSFLDRAQDPLRPSDVFGSMEARWRGTDFTAELEQLVREVQKVASDVLVVDQSASVLAPLELHCVKVLAPGMHPVTFGHQYRRISEMRLTRAREHLHRAGERCESELNVFPHNFP